jgi:H+/Cl- antiporter ClcA
MFLWAIAFGLAAALLGTGIRLIGLSLQPVIERRMIVLMPLVGLGVAALAIAFAEATGKDASEVLFSGQSALPTLVQNASIWTVGALVLLVVCKSVAYGLSPLSSFRGGPVFPSMFIGAAAGVAASHLPGMSLVPGVAMGIGAMATAMLRLPLTATLLATVLLASDGIEVIPVVIVPVVVAYVVTAWLPQTPDELKKKAVRASSVEAGGSSRLEIAGADSR